MTRIQMSRRLASGIAICGALAIGAAAIGALAIGSLAIGALGIGALKIKKLRGVEGQFADLHIDRLTVGHLEIEDQNRSDTRSNAAMR